MIFRVVEELGLSRRFWEPKHGGSNPPHPTSKKLSEKEINTVERFLKNLETKP